MTTHVPNLGEVLKVHAINTKQLIIRDNKNQIFESIIEGELNLKVSRTYESEVKGFAIESYLDN